MAASERGPGSRRAAAPAAEEQQPFPARAGGRVAAAEQDGAHLRGRGRRGHAGGLLRRRAPLSALLPVSCSRLLDLEDPQWLGTHPTRLKTWCLLRIESLRSLSMLTCMPVSSGTSDLSKQRYMWYQERLHWHFIKLRILLTNQ
ncbi:hypothetical protein LEMLEM_LOCUS27219 [Lemmus lemmus]